MPGWFVHMEVARDVATRMRDGELPGDLSLTPDQLTQLKDLGEKCHTWRNYLAIGSLGPDLFYLLPDFAGDTGDMVLTIVQELLDVWELFDPFKAGYDKWLGPLSADTEDLLNQVTGGLSSQLTDAMTDLLHALLDVVLTVISRLTDWFGILSSGVPKGYADSAF